MKRPDSHFSLKVLNFEPAFNLWIFTAVFHQADDKYEDGASLLCTPFLVLHLEYRCLHRVRALW